MAKSETENRRLVFKYYKYALRDLKDEVTDVEEMSHILECFEEEENYLACAGIISAIEDYEEIKLSEK